MSPSQVSLPGAPLQVPLPGAPLPCPPSQVHLSQVPLLSLLAVLRVMPGTSL
ncbi:hypothetical protein GBAR_LOCUS23001, partial [Geodia barretti]